MSLAKEQVPVVTTTTTTTTLGTTTTTHNYTGTGFCSGGVASYNCGSENNCFCQQSLALAIGGASVDTDRIDNNLGPDNPIDIFKNGGSENIPVSCRAAKYQYAHDPAWLEAYFDLQLHDPSVGFLGREIFSSTYQALVAGAAVAILNRAVALGHKRLQSLASEWLRGYWTMLALTSTESSLQRTGAYHINQSTTGNSAYDEEAVSRDLLGGYGVALASNRSYVNSSNGGTGLQYILLSLALNHPTRKYGWTLDQSPGFYGGLCSTVKSVGYDIANDGKIDLKSKAAPAAAYGLTDAERSLLQTFISSNGTVGLQSVLSILSPLRVKCEMTIIRTDQGLITWFGNETSRTDLCSRSKGGSFVASSIDYASNTSVSLSRTALENWPSPAQTWLENGQICEETEGLPRQCMPLPGGPTRMKLYWPVGQEIQVP